MKKKYVVIFVSILAIVCSIVLLSLIQKVEFSLENNSVVTIEYGTTEIEKVNAKVKTIFNKNKISLKIQQQNEVDLTKLGSYQVTYKTIYRNKEYSISITYNVVDTTPPEITLVSNEDYFTDYGAEYIEEGYSAFDIYDQDITANVTSSIENGIVTYTVSDSSGNVASVTRTINYKDLSAPIITFSRQFPTAVKVGSSFQMPTYQANDYVDGDVTSNVVVTGKVDTSKKGVNEITFKVSDQAGNQTIVKRVVYVYDIQESDPTVSAGTKIVYLTFDDGPSQYTAQLLDVLAKYNVKVTFFVTGNRSEYRASITRAFNEGHTIAAHTYCHNYNKIYQSETAFWDDIEKCNDMIESLTGTRSTLFRFAGGSSNTVSRFNKGIMTKLASAASLMGYKYCDWNITSGDTGGTTSAKQVATNVINGLKKNTKTVWVLQHDTKKFSVQAVEEIIIWGLANGYTFLPMDASSPVSHHRIAN